MEHNLFIARDKNKTLRLFEGKPTRENDCWISSQGRHLCELKSSISDIDWKDEPIGVCLCLNDEKYHTVKLEELERLYRVDWNYSDMKEAVETFEDKIQRYNNLPWYKRIFRRV